MKLVIATILTTFFIINIYSQENSFSQGSPLINNYSSTEYNAGSQNWDIVQNKSGIMYFCNNVGILEFDGETWRIIPMENNSIARTIELYNDTIFVGGNNTFGYLDTDSVGKTKYVSISKILPDNQKNFGDIWYIEKIKNKKIFVSIKGIFVYENKRINKIGINNDIISALTIGDDFLFLDSTSIYIIKDNNLSKIYSFEKTISRSSYLFKLNNNEFVIINDKPQIFNIKNILSDKNDFIKTIKIDRIKELTKNPIYNFDIDKNGNIVFATMSGVFIYNKDFKLLNLIDRNSGFITNDIYNVYFDYYSNLWVAHGAGVSYIELNSPITIFGKSQNVFDANLNITEYKNKLYLSSMSKIKILEKGKEEFYDFEKSDYNNFANCKIELENDTILLITTGDKIYYTIGDKLELLYSATKGHEVIVSLLWTSNHKNKIFFGTISALRYLDFSFNNNKLKVDSVGTLNVNGMIMSIAADNKGNIWAAPFFNRLCKLSYNKEDKEFIKYSFGKKDGLEDSKNRVVFDKYINELFVINDKVYSVENKYNSDVNKYTFSVDSKYYNNMNSKDIASYIYNKNNILLQGNSNVYSFKRINNKITDVDSISYKRLSGFVNSGPHICIGSDGIQWMPYQTFLVRFDPSKIKDVKYYSLPSIISEINNSDSIIYAGRDTALLKDINAFKYNKNSFVFKYSVPFFVGDIKYKYKLEGFDEKWSKLTKETKAVYTNIDAGEYAFIVKGINIYGLESKEAKFSFVILPPWYKTVWAYTIYFILFILVVTLIVFLFTRNLKERNKKLEYLVKERTKEIQAKNALITDSIKYAKHIQKAVLPSSDIIAKEFRNAFIFFKPRDIVSGDFYWYHKKNNIHYVAVADCTGHGVPGAFMSMIGNTLLNQIIREENIDTPSEILGRLNEEIIKAFASSETQDDGMDITICKIDRNNNTFELSMANHVALIVKENKLEEIEGDIFSIGGPFAKPQKIGFSNHKYNIEPGTTLYMFSDGYPDQFGGPEDEKLMISKLKELILENSSKEINKQREVFKDYFVKWKGSSKQIDDVLIIGIKF